MTPYNHKSFIKSFIFYLIKSKHKPYILYILDTWKYTHSCKHKLKGDVHPFTQWCYQGSLWVKSLLYSRLSFQPERHKSAGTRDNQRKKSLHFLFNISRTAFFPSSIWKNMHLYLCQHNALREGISLIQLSHSLSIVREKKRTSTSSAQQGSKKNRKVSQKHLQMFCLSCLWLLKGPVGCFSSELQYVWYVTSWQKPVISWKKCSHDEKQWLCPLSHFGNSFLRKKNANVLISQYLSWRLLDLCDFLTSQPPFPLFTAVKCAYKLQDDLISQPA